MLHKWEYNGMGGMPSSDWLMSICIAWEYRLNAEAATNMNVKPVKLCSRGNG